MLLGVLSLLSVSPVVVVFVCLPSSLSFVVSVLIAVCLFLWLAFFIGRTGQSAPAMARCRIAAAGSSAPDTIIAQSLFWKVAACAKARPALESGFGTHVHSRGSTRHSLKVQAKIYTGHGRHLSY